MTDLTNDERRALTRCRKLLEKTDNVPFAKFWSMCQFHSLLGPRHLSVAQHLGNLAACVVLIEETPSPIEAAELVELVRLLDSGKSVALVAPVRAVRDHAKAQIMAAGAPVAGSC
jgi:hypothetical protein